MKDEREGPRSAEHAYCSKTNITLPTICRGALLSQAGAEVVGPAGTLDEAVQRVDEGAFDCAIVDMNLRGQLAYLVAEQLKSAKVPFIAATGYNQATLPEWLQTFRVSKSHSRLRM
jgi:CheY-like chemotaxis protein